MCFPKSRAEQLRAFTYTSNLNFVFSEEESGPSDDREGQALCSDTLKNSLVCLGTRVS